ncbi:hypothetical protein [Thiospirillum jenense]|uniref:YtxH domain-containing protein n=1 Tax=Thiospirillum jenense TaxID=1653858 RepID=A0A839HLF4_9GAMM|nr:hypothetical protein [Thiospirillum jenense]MBB1127378.1 hypothetical protein [Thiospirillum jenense]
MNQPFNPPGYSQIGAGYQSGFHPQAGGYPNHPSMMNGSAPGIGQTAPWSRFIKGALIGAAATYLLTNEQVQRTAIKGIVQAWSFVQGSVEEMKERFGDAEAELRHTQQQREP